MIVGSSFSTRMKSCAAHYYRLAFIKISATRGCKAGLLLGHFGMALLANTHFERPVQTPRQHGAGYPVSSTSQESSIPRRGFAVAIFTRHYLYLRFLRYFFMHEDLSLTAVKKPPCTVPGDKGQRLYFLAYSRNARGALADRWIRQRQVYSTCCAFNRKMMTTHALVILHLRLRGNFRTIHAIHRANITGWYYADIDSHQRSLLGVLDLLKIHLFFDSFNLMGWAFLEIFSTDIVSSGCR